MTNLYQIKDEALSEEEERLSHERDRGEDEGAGEHSASGQGKGKADSELMGLKEYARSQFMKQPELWEG